MKTRFYLLSSLSFSVAACGPLSSRPGDDFQVRSTVPDLQVVQQVGPHQLEFSVDGCDDFVVDLTVAGGPTQRIEATPLGNGRFAAKVAPEQLHGPDTYCLYDSENPQVTGVSLDVTCKLDGRTRRDNLRVSYAPAYRAVGRTRGPVDAVFAGEGPHRFYEVGSGWLDSIDANARDVGPDVFAATAPQPAPLLAASPSGIVHLWSGCPLNDCGIFFFVDTTTRKTGTSGAYVQTFDWANGARFLRNVKVPGGAVDLVSEGNGSVLLSANINTTVVTYIENEIATVRAVLDGETEPSKTGMLDGQRVFLTRVGDASVRLRRTDGSLVADLPLPGVGSVEYLSLAPNADAFVTIRGERIWLSTLTKTGTSVTATSTELVTELTGLSNNTAEDSSFGAAWTTSGVLVRSRGAAEMFARAVPFARTWKTSVENNAIVSAMGLGESVALLTSTGLRIYDNAGALVGGADPIAPACSLDYAPRHAAVVGPETIALAGRRSTYQFRANLPR